MSYLPIGIPNVGSSCHLNSVLQLFTHFTEFSEKLKNFDGKFVNVFKKFLKYYYQRNVKKMINEIKIMRNCFLKQYGQQDSTETLFLIMNELHNETTMLFDKTNKYSYLFEKQNKKYSLINEAFGIWIVEQIKCISCSNMIFNFNIWNALGLSVKKNINESLEDFFAPILVENVHCDKCNKKTEKIKTFWIAKLPKYYFFCFFNRVNQNIKKNYDFVNVDSELNLKNYVLASTKTKNIRLTSIICHLGNETGGHYKIYKKIENQWYDCNDDKIKLCTQISKHETIYAVFFSDS